MKIFSCGNCEQVVYFESVQCTRCGHTLAFLPDRGVVSALEQAPAPTQGQAQQQQGSGEQVGWRALGPNVAGALYRLCRNYTEQAVCNWAVAADDSNEYCRACRLNHMIPNVADAQAMEAWHRLELAKRRLIYTLLELGLPVEGKAENPERGLAFDFLQDDSTTGSTTRVFTGHDDGLITINIAEADNPFREKMREHLGETYRTVLGHFRHESGHYYWDRLIAGTPRQETFRELFGDEQLNYEEARARHYKEGPPPQWWDRFVSAYASMHPWEDWAETWAHYLHMVEGIDTARAYGLSPRLVATGAAPETARGSRRLNPHSFDDLIKAWIPLTVALNSMNRTFGLTDCYPFVLTKAAIDKLRFVHDLVEEQRARLDHREIHEPNANGTGSTPSLPR
jgi:hypothetical protein